jgi:dihydroorotate dehydrogenase
MSFYKKFVSPVLDRLDSETMHDVVREALHYAEITRPSRAMLGLIIAGKPLHSEKLRTSVAGINFENPVQVAAGWDKQGRAVRALFLLGFGSVEVGSVLQHPQPGNPKPRQWVISPGVIINALGFNSPGMEAVAHNLLRYRDVRIPIGVNIGKNKDVPVDDTPRAYAIVAKCLYQDASYFVINVSSPNTPGLRRFQDRPLLTEIVKAVCRTLEECGGPKPTFVKIAPDITEEALNEIIEVVCENKLAGIVATNSSDNPELKTRYGKRWREQPGGLSGDDETYRQMSTAKIAHIYRETGGKITIIGVGGVKDGPSALEKLRAGASLVQVMSGLRGEGLGVAHQINHQLAEWMERTGVSSIAEVVGLDARAAR